MRVRGGGDSSVGLKVALPSRSESFHWAALGTYSIPTGSPSFSDGYSRELGVTASWDLAQQRAIALYVNYARDDDGHTWTFAPNYTFFRRPFQQLCGSGRGHRQRAFARGRRGWRLAAAACDAAGCVGVAGTDLGKPGLARWHRAIDRV